MIENLLRLDFLCNLTVFIFWVTWVLVSTKNDLMKGWSLGRVEHGFSVGETSSLDSTSQFLERNWICIATRVMKIHLFSETNQGFGAINKSVVSGQLLKKYKTEENFK